MIVIGRASGLRFQGKATKKSSCCIELDTCVMLGGNLFKDHARMDYGPNRQSSLRQVLIISDGEVTTDDLTQGRHK
ncbi:hypothetical protein YC2023_078502 [Brassica napus]